MKKTMKQRIWIASVIILSLTVFFTISHPETVSASESLSGFWESYQKLYSSNWNTENVTGPSRANVTADSSRLTIFVRGSGGTTYEFNTDRSGNQLTGTVLLKSGMGTFSHPVQGEISPDGNRIVLRSDYIYTYNGRQDRWNKDYKDKETWEFTREKKNSLEGLFAP
jgi:hypothetical protein